MATESQNNSNSKASGGRRFRFFGSSSNTADTETKQKPQSRSETMPATMDLPGLPHIQLTGYKPSTKHRILPLEVAEDIRLLLSPRMQLYTEWKLVYSLEQDGASLNTLYTKNSPDYRPNSKPDDSYRPPGYVGYGSSTELRSDKIQKKSGYVLVIKDTKGGLFGSFTTEHFHPSESKRFYGTGECFLWKCKRNKCFTIEKDLDNNKIKRSNTLGSYGEDVRGESLQDLQRQQEEQQEPGLHHVHDSEQDIEYHLQFFAYPFTGLNHSLIYCTKDFISLGTGNGHYGLWLDDNLLTGRSSKCDTFGNEPLSEAGEKFKISSVEIWKIGG